LCAWGFFNFVLINFWSLPFCFFQFFCKLWAINGSSILFSQLWAIWGVFFLNVKFGVLRFDLVNMPSFQFFKKKLRSFQLFSSHFGGLHFIFSKGGWGLWISFWPSFLSSLWWFQPSVFIVIFVFRKTIHYVTLGDFLFF